MARNTQIKHQARHTTLRQYGGTRASYGKGDFDNKDSVIANTGYATGYTNGDAKLNRKQILLFWSVTLIMMLVVFVAGYKAGRVEGAREILDQVDQQMVRLPIVRPLDLSADSDSVINSGDLDSTSRAKEDLQYLKAAESTETRTSSVNRESSTDNKIDFTKKESLPLVPVDNLKDPAPKKNDSLYEEVYPGKQLFPPPSSSKPSSASELAKNDDSLIEPMLPSSVETRETNKNIVPIKEFFPTPGWYVQVSAAPSEADARAVHKKISSQGFEVKLEEASIRDKVYYRILVGPYPDRKDALTNRGKVKAASGVSGEPFIRQVK